MIAPMNTAPLQELTLSPWMLVVAVIVAGFVLYAAYKIGKFVLRVLAGLLFLAALAAVVWHLFFRGP